MNAKQRKWGVVAGIVLTLIAGRLVLHNRSQRAVLENSDQFILYSLLPYPQHNVRTAGSFHRYKILGQTMITDPKVKAELVNSLYGGISSFADQAACFNPRHGIRAVRDGRVVEVVICFQCGQVGFYENRQNDYQPISSWPEEVFDHVLNEAKVPLGKR